MSSPLCRVLTILVICAPLVLGIATSASGHSGEEVPAEPPAREVAAPDEAKPSSPAPKPDEAKPNKAKPDEAKPDQAKPAAPNAKPAAQPTPKKASPEKLPAETAPAKKAAPKTRTEHKTTDKPEKPTDGEADSALNAKADAATSKDEDEDPPWYPFGGTLLLSQSLGTGTFIDGPAASPYFNLALVLRPHVVLSKEFDVRIRAKLGFDINALDNADSLRDYSGQPLLWDIDLGVSVTPLTMKFDVWPTSSAPAIFELTTAFDLIFPASLASQIATKYLGLRLEVAATFAPFDWLEVGYTLGATKNFNRFPNTVINASDFSAPPVARAGGAAGVDTLLIATGQGVTEWGVSNTVHLGFSFLERVNITVEFGITHAFTYLRNIPKDALSSPHAQANRGRSEVMTGSIELAVDIIEHLSVAIGTITEQAPYSPDGETLRSPFWDATNGAANRQVIYLDIIGSM